MTPSRPAPSNRSNQSARKRPIARRRREVDRRAALPSTSSSRARRSACGHRAQVLVAERQQVPGDEARPASRRPASSPATRPGGSAAAATRSRARRRCAMTTSPSSTQRSGSAARNGSASSGKVAIERLQVARLRVDLVAVAEDERPEAVPLRLEQPAVVRSEARRRPWRASARRVVRRAVPCLERCTARPRSRQRSRVPPSHAHGPGSTPPDWSMPAARSARADAVGARRGPRCVARSGEPRQRRDHDRHGVVPQVTPR